jgi:hypothetical protein
VQAGRLLEQARTVLHGASLGVWRGVIDAGEAGMGDRPGAHRAGLQRHPQVAIVQPLLPQGSGGGANHQHFGMGSGIVQRARAIVRGGNHLSP